MAVFERLAFQHTMKIVCGSRSMGDGSRVRRIEQVKGQYGAARHSSEEQINLSFSFQHEIRT